MNGLVVMGAALALFVLAVGGIGAATLFGLRALGQALNPNRPAPQRRMRAAFAVMALCGILVAAVGGFSGMAALMYYAPR